MKRLLFTLLLLAWGWWLVGPDLRALLGRITLSQFSPVPEVPATVSLSYALATEKWLEFPLPPAVQRVKVVVNGIIPEPVEEKGPATDYPLAVAYQVARDKQAAPIREGIYHLQSRVTRGLSENSAKPIPEVFFYDRKEQPLDGRHILFDLADANGEGGVLRLRLVPPGPPCTGAVVRVYCMTPTPANHQEHAWQRMSLDEKTGLASGNAYPVEFLNDQEIQNLVRWEWRPQSPTSLQDVDYVLRRLYIVREELAPDTGEVIDPEGLILNKGRRATIPLPPAGARLRLTFTPLRSEKETTDVPLAVTINWYGTGADSSRTWEVTSPSHTDFFGGGLLELRAVQPLLVKVYDADRNADITPQPLHALFYLTGAGEPVTYAIKHAGKNGTPLRLTVRAILETPGVSASQVRYHLLDREDKEITQGTLAFTPEPSAYDWLGGEAGTALSDPAQYFFNVPAETAKMVIQCESSLPLLIALASRPPDFAATIRVPSDYFRGISDQPRMPFWFFKEAVAPQDLLAADRIALVQVQYRPPVDDPDLKTGNFAWEQFRPLGNWSGQYLLTLRDPGSPLREEALGSTFKDIEAGRAVTLRFRSEKGAASLTPRCIYLRDRTTPLRLNFILDNVPLHQEEVALEHGIFTLPRISAGTHTLRVEAGGPARLLLSNIDDPSAAHLLRFANKLTPDLQFEISKRSGEQESFSLLYFPVTGNNAAPGRIHATLLADNPQPGPFSSSTIRRRSYLLEPQQGQEKMLLLARDRQYTGPGQNLYFPLGSDLPPGNYRLLLRPEKGTEGYIQLYRVTPGEYEQRILSTE